MMTKDYGIAFLPIWCTKANQPHGPHTKMVGRLWWKKVEKCLGYQSARDRELYYDRENHRHFWFLSRCWTDSEMLVFVCDHHHNCKGEHRILRQQFWATK